MANGKVCLINLDPFNQNHDLHNRHQNNLLSFWEYSGEDQCFNALPNHGLKIFCNYSSIKS